VTAACLAIKKKDYVAVGGLNETDLAVAFNDIDLCLKIRQAGLKVIYTPWALLYHHESVSRGYEDTAERQRRFGGEGAYMKKAWSKWIAHDPAYNPNLTLLDHDFSLAWPPRVNALR
jgi:hypothetical protein